jgi:hypothetical protein
VLALLLMLSCRALVVPKAEVACENNNILDNRPPAIRLDLRNCIILRAMATLALVPLRAIVHRANVWCKILTISVINYTSLISKCWSQGPVTS